jgi:hypothetical protein
LPQLAENVVLFILLLRFSLRALAFCFTVDLG